jgi:hypothetical protein
MGQAVSGIGAPKARTKSQTTEKLKQKSIKFAPKPNEIPLGEIPKTCAENLTTYSAHP